jgi:uncharacterized protein (UPF0335 family)
MDIKERSEEDIKKLTQDFAKKIINLMKQKKDIDKDIKIIKQEAKLDGINAAKVTKYINTLKKELKTNAFDKQEEERIASFLDTEEIILDVNELVNES